MASRNVQNAISITPVLLEIGTSRGGAAKPKRATSMKSTIIRNLGEPWRLMRESFHALQHGASQKTECPANLRARLRLEAAE